MTTTTSATPILLSATPTATAGGMSIDLVFDTAMMAGSGTITITDGAVQTVIDRATGQPTMRVVGATDTHTISAASLGIDGSHVKLDVPGLLPDHAYSIVMGNGVLVSSAHVAFSGVRSTSQIRFTTDPLPDNDGPTLVSHEIDSGLLKSGGSVQVTLNFSEPVSGLTADLLSAPNATVSALAAVGDGHSWVATLVPQGAAEQAANVLTIDMNKVHDATGNAGKGIVNVASYAVDTKGPSATIALDGTELTSGHDIVATVSFSEAVKGLDAAALQAGHAAITGIASEDGKTWKVTLHGSEATTAGGNVLSVDLGKVLDLAGNTGSGVVASAGYAVDTQAPAGVSIALDGTLLKTGGSVGVTFTFSEAVKALPASAILAPNAMVDGLASADGGRTWTGTLTATNPNTSSGNTISVDMSKLQDLKGNAGSGSLVSSASYAIDTVAPTLKPADIQLSGNLVTQNDSVEVTIKFSEKVSLGADAIQAPNVSLLGLSTSDGGLSWKAMLRPSGPVDAGNNVLSIDMGKVHDAAGNAGSGSVSAAQAYAVDTAGPTATIALDGTELKRGGSIGVTITLSDKASQADVAGALAAQNASFKDDLRSTDDGLTWKATLVTTGAEVDETNVVTLDLSKLHDARGTAGTGFASSSNYLVDNTVTTFVDSAIRIIDSYGPSEDDYVSNEANQWISFDLSGALGYGQNIEISVDGHVVSNSRLKSEGNYWYLNSEDTWFADGAHTVSARVVDAAHHSSATVTRQFTIDTVGPTMLTSPDGASGVGTGDDLVFTFDEAMYPIVGEGYSVITFTDSSGQDTRVDIYESNLSADRKTLTIGAAQHHLETGKDYTVYMPSSLTDLAGNSIHDLAPLHFRTGGADTLAPSAQSAVAQVWKGIYGLNTSIDIKVTFSEAVKVAGSGTPVLLLSNKAKAVFDHLSEDQHTMVFKYIVGANNEDDTDNLELGDGTGLIGHVSDLAGNLLDGAHINYTFLENQSPSGYGGPIQIDAHAGPAPGVPKLDAGSDTGAIGDNLTSLTRPTLSGKDVSSNATIKIFEGDKLLATTEAETDGSWTITSSDWTEALGDGVHKLVARQYDLVHNESPASGALTLTVDTSVTPATVGLLADSDKGDSGSDLLTSVARPTFTGTGEAGAHVNVFDGSTIVGETDVRADGTYEVLAKFNLAEGEHTLTVEQTDLAGNTSLRAASSPLTFRIDLTPPSTLGKAVLDAASDSGKFDNDGITNDKTPTLTGTGADPGRAVRLYEGDTLIGLTTADASGNWSYTIGSKSGYLAEFGDGVHTLTVRQDDAAGNLSAISTPLAVTIDTAGPTIMARELEWKSGAFWYEIEFSERIVFASDRGLDVLDTFNTSKSHHAGNSMTNWEIDTNDLGLQTKLELNLGTLIGLFHLKADTGAILDLAGNAAVIGVPSFDIPGIPS